MYVNEIMSINENLSESEINKEILVKLKSDTMNSEEERELKKIIKKNKKLFLTEGDNLTNVKEVMHYIETTTD